MREILNIVVLKLGEKPRLGYCCELKPEIQIGCPRKKTKGEKSKGQSPGEVISTEYKKL